MIVVVDTVRGGIAMILVTGVAIADANMRGAVATAVHRTREGVEQICRHVGVADADLARKARATRSGPKCSVAAARAALPGDPEDALYGDVYRCGHLRGHLRHMPAQSPRRWNSAGQPVVQSAETRAVRII